MGLKFAIQMLGFWIILAIGFLTLSGCSTTDFQNKDEETQVKNNFVNSAKKRINNERY